MFLFRIVSVKNVKNRSDAFGPSSAMTAGMVVVAARSMVAGSGASSVVRFRFLSISVLGSGPLLRSPF